MITRAFKLSILTNQDILKAFFLYMNRVSISKQDQVEDPSKKLVL